MLIEEVDDEDDVILDEVFDIIDEVEVGDELAEIIVEVFELNDRDAVDE